MTNRTSKAIRKIKTNEKEREIQTETDIYIYIRRQTERDKINCSKLCSPVNPDTLRNTVKLTVFRVDDFVVFYI